MRKRILEPCPHCGKIATYTTIYDTTPSNPNERSEGKLYYTLVSCDNEKCGKVIAEPKE